jgi:hypothetical protein
MLDAIERAADSAGIVLSSTLVSDWVVRVQRSLSEDVELAPSEVQALLKPGDAKDHASDSNRLATAPPSGRLGLLSRLSPPVRFAIGVVAVVVALGVILFAILAPEAFVRMLSE